METGPLWLSSRTGKGFLTLLNRCGPRGRRAADHGGPQAVLFAGCILINGTRKFPLNFRSPHRGPAPRFCRISCPHPGSPEHLRQVRRALGYPPQARRDTRDSLTATRLWARLYASPQRRLFPEHAVSATAEGFFVTICHGFPFLGPSGAQVSSRHDTGKWLVTRCPFRPYESSVPSV